MIRTLFCLDLGYAAMLAVIIFMSLNLLSVLSHGVTALRSDQCLPLKLLLYFLNIGDSKHYKPLFFSLVDLKYPWF